MARPKKHILLIDANETRRGITHFVLETHGYFVLGAASVWQAGEIGSEELCAGYSHTLLLGYAPLNRDFLQDVAETRGYPWLFIEPFLHRGRTVWPSMADVLERVRLAAAIKRGPMKGWKQQPKAVQPALAEACA